MKFNPSNNNTNYNHNHYHSNQTTKRQMMRMTPQGKQHLNIGGHSSASSSIGGRGHHYSVSPLHANNNNSLISSSANQPPQQHQRKTTKSIKQNKFIRFFQSINNSVVDASLNQDTRKRLEFNQNMSDLYMSKMEQYSQKKLSQIDKILRSGQQQDGDVLLVTRGILKKQYKPANVTATIHVKPNIKERISSINNFFAEYEDKTKQQRETQESMLQSEILQISTFGQILRFFQTGKNNNVKHTSVSVNFQQQKQQTYDTNNLSTPPTKNNLQFDLKEIQINTQSASRPIFPKSSEKIFKKADILLVQILREKKRKGLVTDYYKIMQMKLFSLLNYIVEDEKQYNGLNSVDKMKEVLKKLDSFKGKTIDGESKINLLKIFFEEFRNLKNQMSADTTRKRSYHKAQTTRTAKEISSFQNNEETARQQKQTSIKTPIKQQNSIKQWQKKNSKDTRSFDGNNQKGKLKTEDSKMSRSVKDVQDEWMGELIQ